MLAKTGYWYSALLVLSAAAFWPRYLSQVGSGLDVHTHAHALVALAWVLLLIGQPLLVRRHRRLHRLGGALSYVLAPLFVAASLLLAHSRFRSMDDATFSTEAPSLFLPLSAAVLFGLSYALGLAYRKTPSLHGRFMVATGLPMIDPVVGRVVFFFGPQLPNALLYQVITFGLTDLVLVGLALGRDLPRSLRRAFLLPALVFPVSHLAWFSVVQGPLWTPVASWFRGLPLP